MKAVLKKSLLLFSVGAASLFFLGGINADRRDLGKPDVLGYKFLDGNRLNSVQAFDGPYCDYRKTGNSGLEWPKGSGKTSIFTAGIWMAGRHRPSGTIRTANMDYGTEYQPGPLTETFNTTTNDDAGPASRANDPRYRLYKIQKNKPDGESFGNPELDIDAWTEWPGDLGAPYNDLNSNGVWDPGVDEPAFKGDQMMWGVINDASRALHNALGATSPMGVEVQILYFVFNQPGPLGDMMFMQWQIINKSDADYDSVFVGMWSDPDLGDANDDLPGSDSLLSLGYIYNGDNDDGTDHGYGARPPAAGFDFFQGPIVDGAPTDSAKFKGQWIQGKRNLPASSFVVYTNGTFPEIIDPPDGSPEYRRIAYDYHLGKAGTVGVGIQRADGTPYPTFWFSGDPTPGGGGDLPANFPLGVFNPQDIRVMINTGPFTLAQGDTQEIVGCLLHAQGADRLGSVSLLKQVDRIAQQAFDDDFNVPSAPPLPDIVVSELPNQILIDWSTNSDRSEDYVFINPVYDYRFEGYNLYQGESVNGPWKRIATYDLVNGIELIEDYEQDPETGNSYLRPVQYGTDSGLKRYFNVTQDYLGGTPLINGKEYYFALTTYAYNYVPGAIDLGLIMALEFAKEPITVVPKGLPVGSTVPNVTGDVLAHNRNADDALTPEVIDPIQSTGATYTVRVAGTGANVTEWYVISGSDTAARSTNFTGDDSSPLVNGILFRLANPVAGVRRATQPDPAGYVYLPEENADWAEGANSGDTWASGAASYANDALTGFGSGQSQVPANELKKVEIRFGETSKAYRWLKNVPTFPPIPIKDPSFVPFVLKKGPGHVYQGDFATVTVPLAAYEVDSLDGDPTPRRLTVGFLENNDSLFAADGTTYLGLGAIDGQWNPTTADQGGLEGLYVFSTTYSEAETSKYNVRTDRFQDVDLYYIVHVRKTSATATWSPGDRIVITPNYVLEDGRSFSVTSQAPVADDPQLASTQMEKINVFPNPYFGRNQNENNQFNRFVTFTNLPSVATIKIFAITGELIRTIDHNDNTTLHRWDLRNINGLPVASGVYIVYIEIPDAGSRILKVAIIQPEERSTRI